MEGGEQNEGGVCLYNGLAATSELTTDIFRLIHAMMDVSAGRHAPGGADTGCKGRGRGPRAGSLSSRRVSCTHATQVRLRGAMTAVGRLATTASSDEFSALEVKRDIVIPQCRLRKSVYCSAITVLCAYQWLCAADDRGSSCARFCYDYVFSRQTGTASTSWWAVAPS